MISKDLAKCRDQTWRNARFVAVFQWYQLAAEKLESSHHRYIFTAGVPQVVGSESRAFRGKNP